MFKGYNLYVDNQITNAGAIAFAQFLQGNTTLFQCSFNGMVVLSLTDYFTRWQTITLVMMEPRHLLRVRHDIDR
jgi:hypothetical protein